MRKRRMTERGRPYLTRALGVLSSRVCHAKWWVALYRTPVYQAARAIGLISRYTGAWRNLTWAARTPAIVAQCASSGCVRLDTRVALHSEKYSRLVNIFFRTFTWSCIKKFTFDVVRFVDLIQNQFSLREIRLTFVSFTLFLSGELRIIIRAYYCVSWFTGELRNKAPATGYRRG